jgi:hypothetical protein
MMNLSYVNMVDFGWPWLNLVGHCSLWLPLAYYGSLRLSMIDFGLPWLTMVIHG